MKQVQKPKQDLRAILVAVGLALIGTGAYVFLMPEKPAPVVEAVPQIVSQPVYAAVPQDNPEVRQWAEAALSAIMTYNYNSLPLVKSQQRHYFSAKGYAGFNEAMARAQIYEKVIANQQTSKLKVICPAQIIRSGGLGDRTVWAVSVPAELKYSNGSQVSAEYYTYELVIEDTTNPDKPYAINQIIGTRPSAVPASCPQ